MILCALIYVIASIDYGKDPATEYYTYRKCDDPVESWRVELPDFNDPTWTKKGDAESIVTQSDSVQISSDAGVGTYLEWSQTPRWDAPNWTHVKINCPTASGQKANSDGQCWTHFYNQHHGNIKWGANALNGNFSKTYLDYYRWNDTPTPRTIIQLKKISNQNSQAIYFGKPEIMFYVEPYKPFTDYKIENVK